MRSKMALFGLLTIILILSLILPGCGSTPTTTATSTTTAAATTTTTSTTTTAPPTSSTPTTTPVVTVDMYGGVYHYPLNVAPASPLGYPVESNTIEGLVASAALERLLLTGDNSVIEPRLATSWDIDVPAKTMTFHLRKGVKFHDGSDFTAEVVKWNFDLQIAAGKATNWVSVDVIDTNTVKITVKVYQNTSLTGVGAYPVASKAAFDKNGIDYARENPIGTGPFIFVEHERGTRVSFTKNENYWEPGKPYLDGVDFVIIADQTVRNLAFKRGDIHEFTAAGLDAQELVQLGYAYHQRTGGTFVLVPDSANPDSPFSNIKVRQAVAYAIDRESLAKNLGYGFARAAYQIFPGFEIAAIPGLAKTEYNPEKARQLLTEAGYPNGFETIIHSQGYTVPSNWVTAVAAMLTEVGITTTPDFPDSGKYSEYRFGSWNNSLLAQGFGNFDNLNSLWGFYFGTTAFKSRTNPPSFVAASEASLAAPEVDPALVKECIRIIAEELMVIPYLEETVMIFQAPGAHNAGLDVATQVQFWAHLAWLEPEAR
jgi:peptide/nickel transport system substrate-binding protein